MTVMGSPARRTYDVHSALRRATERSHLALHVLPQFAAIEAGRLSLTDYGRLLGGLHAFHGAIAGAAEAGGLLAVSSSPRRLAAIEADLAAIGETSPLPAPLLSASGAGLWGSLYVAEGSALGGRVIARQLDYLLESTEGRSFFAGDGATGPVWRAFLAELQAAVPGEADLPQVAAGAEAAFALFRTCVE
jgi:heme oxygenase (biliverdin-IX-beta and delta-forming)